MSNFYTNVTCRRNKIYFRGVKDGVRVKEIINYRPTLFLPSNEKTKYKTLENQYVKPFEFENIKQAKEFIEDYKGVDNFTFYGNTNFQYCYISDYYSDCQYDISQIVIANFDIEVGSENGFPEPESASEPVTAITIQHRDKFYVFACGEYTPTADNIIYSKSENERELLQKFLQFWEEISPDIITGWNIQFFDIPYLVQRITNLFDEKEASRLSPWGFISTRKVNIFNKDQACHELVGISTLDYLEMYRRFAKHAENYKLNTIAHLVLGEKKLDYSQYGSLLNLYKKDFQKFIDYNIKDVDLVDKIDGRMGYINQVLTIAYDAKVNFSDVFTQVRMWDSIIFNELKKENIVVPQKERNNKSEQYAGAYVKDVNPGMYNWVASFDLDALYPHLIAQYNISPETIVDEHLPNTFYKDSGYDVGPLLNKEIDLNFSKDYNFAVAANGHMFTKSKQGFLPRILMKMYEDRKSAKKKMIECKKALELIEQELQKRNGK